MNRLYFLLISSSTRRVSLSKVIDPLLALKDIKSPVQWTVSIVENIDLWRIFGWDPSPFNKAYHYRSNNDRAVLRKSHRFINGTPQCPSLLWLLISTLGLDLANMVIPDSVDTLVWVSSESGEFSASLAWDNIRNSMPQIGVRRYGH